MLANPSICNQVIKEMCIPECDMRIIQNDFKEEMSTKSIENESEIWKDIFFISLMILS